MPPKTQKEISAKRKFQVPHTFAIIAVIILIAVVLTWIIPAGTFDRVLNAGGRKVVDPQSFHYVSRTPVNPLLIPLYIVKAFAKRISLMLVILFAGSAFHMITKSGALQSILAKTAGKFSDKLYIFIPMLTLIFGLICTTQGVNTFIPFAPIMVMLSLAMGLDSLTGAAIILLGGAIGFATGTLNVNTTIVAQGIAELPLYSGIGYRWVCFAVFFVITNIFLVWYATRIKKHPELSAMYDLDQITRREEGTMDLEAFGNLDIRKITSLALLVVALGSIIYGCVGLGWGMEEMAAIFLAYAVIAGLVSGSPVNDICKNILEGSKKMLGAAYIIGMATSISAIMADGHIIDTVIHAAAQAMNMLPTILMAPAMLLANTIINVFLTSGSGQAAAVMPIMTPLADLLGITRQTAVLTFNFGDGFCNYILPTSTALMGIISAANIPYDRWMKFMWKIFLIWFFAGSVLVMIAQAMHYGPM